MIGYAILAVGMVAVAWLSDVACQRSARIARLMDRWCDRIAGAPIGIAPPDPTVTTYKEPHS